jgi:DNA polymerase
MPWTERQRRLLDAMGLRVWQPASQAGAQAAVPAPPPVAAVPAPVAAPPAPAPVPARPAAPVVARPEVAALDWPALREAVAACRACSLCESRKQTVFGVGDTRAHWLVVGEAPGEQEDEQGEPFVGAAGQLLDRMLHAVHLTRQADGGAAAWGPAQRVFIVNTLKCRPPRNRNPQPDELQHCKPFLDRQIELLAPRIVLLMGRFAVQALLGSDDAIGRLRGRVHRLERFGGVPAVVTYHPSYLLRSPLEKAKAWDDLCLAAAAYAAASAPA